MQISFIPLARRLAVAGAVPVAATLAFASTAFATDCPPPKVIEECHGADVILHVGVTDVGDYAHKGAGTITLEHDGKTKTLPWAWDAQPRPGELAKLTGQSKKKVKGIWKVTVRDLEGTTVAVTSLTLNDDCDEPGPHPSASPSTHPSASPSTHPSASPSPHPSASPSPSPSASPSPSPTPGSGSGSAKPGLPKTGQAAA